jgi:predicted HD phosphohydrolase
VAAAFLHDVDRAPRVSELFGRLPHQENGARWLGPRASAKAAWLVEAHLPAKVFLVRFDPAYVAALSAASVASTGSLAVYDKQHVSE